MSDNENIVLAVSAIADCEVIRASKNNDDGENE